MSEIESYQENSVEIVSMTDKERVTQTVEDLLKIHDTEDGGLYGKVIDNSWFQDESRLGNKDDLIAFAYLTSEVKVEMESRGFTFSARGFKGRKQKFHVPPDYASVVHKYLRNGRNWARRAAVLAAATPMYLLDSDQKRKHEAVALRAYVTSESNERLRRKHFSDEERAKYLSQPPARRAIA